MKLKLKELPDDYAVVRLSPVEQVPAWALTSPFFSLTRTYEELSVVTAMSAVPTGVTAAGPWRALMLEGPFAFDLCGVLVSVLDPLAKASVGIFALSTFDTDYVLVKKENIEKARAAIRAHGHHLD